MGLIIIDRIILFFLCLMIFFLPISTAVIETSACICIFMWIIKQILILIKRLKSGKINFLNESKKLFFNASALNKALILFIFANLLSTIFSSDIGLSLDAFFSKLAEYILIFIIVRNVVNSRMRYRIVIWIVLSALFFIGIDGIFQGLSGYDLFRHRGLFSGTRVTASFINPNTLGSYLITLIPVLLAVVLFNFNRKIKLSLIIMLVVVVSTLVLTYSKGAIAAFAFALVFFAFYTRKRYVLLILLGITLLVVFLPPFFKHSSNINLLKRIIHFSSDAGAIDRKFLWLAAWRMFTHSPFLGVGLGTFMKNYQIFWIRSTTEISYTHNCYLQALAETGIFGLLSFILFLACWFKKSLKILSKINKEKDLSGNKFICFSFLGLTTGLIAYLLNSFIDTNFYSLPIAVLFWFALGLHQAGAGLLTNNNERL